MSEYTAALAELEQFTNYERVGNYPVGANGFGTARMEKILARLNSPEKKIPALHIAGTKGKGSIAYFAAALLRAKNFTVGLYVSPHIVDLRERIQCNGEMISPNDFAAAFFAVRVVADRADPPTYFELLTATAFYYFAQKMVDVAVIEVGLGGRLDATNVASLAVQASAITLIDYDHTQILGASLTEIAREKAGVLRPGIPLVIAAQPPEARVEILRLAAVQQCQIYELHANFPEFDRVPLLMKGKHQRENAALAAKLTELFLAAKYRTPPVLTDEDFSIAWSELKIPARIEVVNHSPVIIVDGAHTKKSIAALAETLRTEFSVNTPRIAILSINRDKPAIGMLAEIMTLFDHIFLTENHSGRAFSAVELQKSAAGISPMRPTEFIVQPSPHAALAAARTIAAAGGLICATGSFYLAAEIRAAVLETNNRDCFTNSAR